MIKCSQTLTFHFKYKNYSQGRISDCPAQNGDTFERTNFSQANPNTEILSGITGLTFKNCNLVNCTVPPDATIIQCNVAQVSRCYHLHPDWGLDPEVENCPHVVEVDEVIIDGVVVDTTYHRKDTRL